MKSVKKLGLFVCAMTSAVIAGAYIPKAQATNLVTNPGFDIDPLVNPNNPTLPNPFITGWNNNSEVENSGFYTIYLENYYALSPDRSAHIAGRTGASLSQVLHTIPDEEYQLSFYLASAEEEPRLDNELNIFAGDDLIATLTDISLQPFTQYQFTFEAESALTELRFDARVNYDWLNLDDVSVILDPEDEDEDDQGHGHGHGHGNNRYAAAATFTSTSVTSVPESSSLAGIAAVGLMGIWLNRKQLARKIV